MEKVRNIKTLLAKLMATENITVRHQAVATASFDPVNRVLTIPVYKDDLSNDELDLFVGHEVGHALFTPSAPIDSYVKGRKYFKDFINIVEDARIEKLIQRRFPGLRKNFIGGYNGLIERGFFGDKNPNDFNFIDRINIYFKTRNEDIQFSDEEQVFVDAIKDLEDWDSTLDLTEKLFEYCGKKGLEKEEEEEQSQQMSSETASADDDGEEMESEEPQSNENQSDENSDENSEEKSQGRSDQEGEDTEDQSNEPSTDDTDDTDVEEENDASEDQTTGNEEQLKSKTSIDFEKGMQELVDLHAGDVYEAPLYKVPTQITSIDRINELIDESINGVNSQTFVSFFEVGLPEEIENKLNDAYSEFVRSQKSVLNYMVKEFEMKKKADEYKRTREAKTGTLNMSKLYNYKFSENLFLKNNITKDGKSHGMVMLVDWSGSMYGQIDDVLQQVQILTAFCQKVNIPFDVYAFTDQMKDGKTYVGYDEPIESNHWHLGPGFSLLHLASSSFNRTQKAMSNKALAFFKKIFDRSVQYGTIMMNRMARELNLGQTPLASGLLSMFPILNEFQNRTNVDILNLVCLTDGEGQCRVSYDQNGQRGKLPGHGWSADGNFILKGKKADYRIKKFSDDGRPYRYPQGYSVHRQNMLETNLYNILREEFDNLRITGFYLAESNRDALYRIYNAYVLDSANCIWKYGEGNGPLTVKKFNAAKFLKVPVDTFQYDNLFIVKGNSLDLDDTWEVDEATVKSTAKLRKSFSKMMKSKVTDRVLASNFIEVIA